MHTRKLLALFGAVALLAQPQLAAAQAAACIAEEEVSAMAIYAVPSMVRSMQLRCAGELSERGFLVRDGNALAARYATLQNQVWPMAKAGLLKYVNNGNGLDPQSAQTVALVAGLPDANVRPVVDALIVQEVSGKIEPASCGAIERVMAALAPIEPRVAGTLIGVTAGLFADKAPLICPARAT